MSWFFAGFQIINLIIVLGLIGLSIYVMIVLIKFLKTGTLAFQKYLDADKDKFD